MVIYCMQSLRIHLSDAIYLKRHTGADLKLLICSQMPNSQLNYTHTPFTRHSSPWGVQGLSAVAERTGNEYFWYQHLLLLLHTLLLPSPPHSFPHLSPPVTSDCDLNWSIYLFQHLSIYKSCCLDGCQSLRTAKSSISPGLTGPSSWEAFGILGSELEYRLGPSCPGWKG